ncbi:MAG: PIN domain-containing protein [Deltaproteobacteria bacterium]|nr:MAG: PIN domain-containing protein [Deltaproteobacteria bacterium]
MVVDANVFVFALLGVTEYRDEALSVLQTLEDIVVPDLVRAEILNACSKWVRVKGVPEQSALDTLVYTESLVTQVVPTDYLWEQALMLSFQANHGAMDCLYIALAQNKGMKLITYDDKLRKKFPAETLHPTEFLTS